MRPKNKIFLILFLIAIAIGAYYSFNPLLSSSEKNLENEKAELVLSSNDLVNAYSNNEKKSNNLYAGKIIEVTGTIKEITFLNNRNTIILNSNLETFGVICDLHSDEIEKIKQLKPNQKIRVKGICKGFLKDVILLNCTVDILPNE
ncbi:MAG: hypothetical protein WAO74_00080 [Polaribacter sp.]|uniref:OB-fold protein n=1 Tax=Polaribacter sp. TaxID=1920175 RepID=UPI003BB05E1C